MSLGAAFRDGHFIKCSVVTIYTVLNECSEFYPERSRERKSRLR